MKVAAAQLKCELGNVEMNLARSLERIEQAAAEGADLVCFPESVLDGYAAYSSELINLSRGIDSDEIRQVTAAAQKYGLWVMWSLAEKVGARVANTAVLIDRSGQIVMTYRKTHLCAECNETVAYLPGEALPVAPIEGVNVGAMICFDRHFPEVVRTMRLKGADLILHPTASSWFDSDSISNGINTAMMRTRAYENRCFILSVNQANKGGGSALFGPGGEVIGVAGRGDEILYFDVDLDLIRNNPINTHELVGARRPTIYEMSPVMEPPAELHEVTREDTILRPATGIRVTS